MSTIPFILTVFIGFIGFIIILLITDKILYIFGFSGRDVFDLTYVLQFLFKIFFPISLIMFLYPKLKYKNIHYFDDFSELYFFSLIMIIVLTKLIRRKYKRLYKYQKTRYKYLKPHEEKGLTMLLLWIFYIPTAGIIILWVFIKKYFL
jgi:hypothetical protein